MTVLLATANRAQFVVGDTQPPLTGYCTTTTDGVTSRASLAGATSVVVHIRRPVGEPISANVTVTDAVQGAWSYAWQVGDLNIPGDWEAEVQVTYTGGGTQTFGRAAFRVVDQIA